MVLFFLINIIVKTIMKNKKEQKIMLTIVKFLRMHKRGPSLSSSASKKKVEKIFTNHVP